MSIERLDPKIMVSVRGVLAEGAFLGLLLLVLLQRSLYSSNPSGFWIWVPSQYSGILFDPRIFSVHGALHVASFHRLYP